MVNAGWRWDEGNGIGSRLSRRQRWHSADCTGGFRERKKSDQAWCGAEEKRFSTGLRTGITKGCTRPFAGNLRSDIPALAAGCVGLTRWMQASQLGNVCEKMSCSLAHGGRIHIAGVAPTAGQRKLQRDKSAS
ncbi:hypothetical protein KCP76_00945 [Salmonella enterica subsp. enterica serovar Weltevreden]|nr:hypothetical protein KCP76_00945 [Salmonella enterica subsp. enterica serovar Weltevreden]